MAASTGDSVPEWGEVEEEMFGLLVASERVAGWLDVLRSHRAGAPPPRVRQALRDLVAAVEGSEAYTEEARRAGAVPVLTGLLKRTDDEGLLNDVSDALAACSGLMATKGGKPRTFTYGGVDVVLKEGSLGDGTGAKVWSCAHIVCREMASHPSIVAGRRVLEIGAGCGACGILAAKLGAADVTLGDFVVPVLALLRECVHLNAPAGSAAGGAAAAAAAAGEGEGSAAGAAAGGAAEADGEDLTAWDPEDASECGSDDFADLLAEAAGAANGGGSGSGQHSGGGGSSGAQSWDAPPMHVRFHDWQRDVDALEPAERAALAAAPGVPASTVLPPGGSIETPSSGGDSSGGGGGGGGAPELGPEDSFDVVVGTDILYEWPMVVMLPAVLRRRLRPGGRALLCCAVREQAMFDALVAGCRALGLRVGRTRVQPRPSELLDVRTDQYEGGYALLAVEWSMQPAEDGWHRDDLFDGGGDA